MQSGHEGHARLLQDSPDMVPVGHSVQLDAVYLSLSGYFKFVTNERTMLELLNFYCMYWVVYMIMDER
jgi:hypothetical protein